MHEDWAVRILCSAHVLWSTERVDWKTLSGTAKAVMETPALATLPIMEYV